MTSHIWLASVHNEADEGANHVMHVKIVFLCILHASRLWQHRPCLPQPVSLSHRLYSGADCRTSITEATVLVIRGQWT